MAKKSRKRQQKPRLAQPASASHHWYRHGQERDQWIVPLTAGDMPVILHRHPNPDDHSACGPQLFCCGRSLGLYLDLYRSLLPQDVRFQFLSAAEVDDWYRAMSPPFLYFYACDPLNPHRAYFLSVPEEEAWDIIHFFLPIETALIGAEVIV